jgi:acetyl esterase/lipase
MTQVIPMQTYRYGDSAGQEGDLHLPGTPCPPVVALLHGGFWRIPYGREEMEAAARDLAGRGFAVWNIEYRRCGAPGGGWPGTLQDVAAAIDHLAVLAAGGVELDLDHVIAAGHSAGGHLALWAAGRARSDARVFRPPQVPVRAAAGLAPVSDLAAAHALGLGRSAVAEFLGGSPVQVPERYRACSPIEMLPLNLPHLIVHGAEDEAVPVMLSRAYANAARAAGDAVDLAELGDVNHMDVINPHSVAYAVFCQWLSKICSSPSHSRPDV